MTGAEATLFTAPTPRPSSTAALFNSSAHEPSPGCHTGRNFVRRMQSLTRMASQRVGAPQRSRHKLNRPMRAALASMSVPFNKPLQISGTIARTGEAHINRTGKSRANVYSAPRHGVAHQGSAHCMHCCPFHAAPEHADQTSLLASFSSVSTASSRDNCAARINDCN